MIGLPISKVGARPIGGHLRGCQRPDGRTAERFEIAVDQVEHTPFLLIGSVEQVVDKLERLRDDVGISHYVIRDAESFAPVVDALAGR